MKDPNGLTNFKAAVMKMQTTKFCRVMSEDKQMVVRSKALQPASAYNSRRSSFNFEIIWGINRLTMTQDKVCRSRLINFNFFDIVSQNDKGRNLFSSARISGPRVIYVLGKNCRS